jgi:hypothetical protein
VKQKFFILFDDASHTVRVDGGVVLGEYPDRERALQAARVRGMVLGGQHRPEPPASSDAVKCIIADPGTPEALNLSARAALAEAEAADPSP